MSYFPFSAHRRSINVHKQSSLGLQVFKDEHFRVVTSSGGGVESISSAEVS